MARLLGLMRRACRSLEEFTGLTDTTERQPPLESTHVCNTLPTSAPPPPQPVCGECSRPIYIIYFALMPRDSIDSQ
jgi:hypothetical protein